LYKRPLLHAFDGVSVSLKSNIKLCDHFLFRLQCSYLFIVWLCVFNMD